MRYMLLMLLDVVLIGCGTPSVSPPISQVVPTVGLARTMRPRPSASATATLAAVPTIQSPVWSASSTPTRHAVAVKVTARPPQLVVSLPLDQPWVITGETVFASDGHGGVQQLDVPVQAVIERGSLPPLLVTHLHDQFALLDLQTHMQVPLNLPQHWNVSTFLLSSDHRHLAFWAGPNASGKMDFSLYLADMQTGALRVLLDGNQLLRDPRFDYAAGATIEPIAWQGQQLYTHIQESSSSYFWRIDTSQAHPVPGQFLVVGETGPWAIAPTGRIMVWSKLLWSKEVDKESLAHLLTLDTNTDQAIERMQDAVWAPDGLTLAYTRLTNTGLCCDLVLYDLQSQHAQHQIRIDPPLRTQAQGITWAPDGRHLVVVVSTGTVMVVARDGIVVGTAPVHPIVDAVRLTNAGAVVLVIREGEQSILRTMTWATPTQVRTEDTPLPSANDSVALYSLVHAPQ